MTSVWAAVEGGLRRSGRRGRRAQDVWDRLEQLTDLGEFHPKLRDDIEVKRFEVRLGEDYAMAANLRDLIHYRLTWPEADLLPLMDGTRTVREIVLARFRESGELELSSVADLVYQLHVGGFLETPFLDVDAALERGLHHRGLLRSKLQEFATTLRLEWKNADRFARWLYDHGLRAVFTRRFQVFATIVALAGIAAFVSNVRDDRLQIRGDSIALGFLILLGLQLFHIFIHELGHAAVLVHYGRRVKSAGFFIFFGAPAFFIESSDGLMLERRERIVQSAAGPYSGLLVAGVFSILVWFEPSSFLAPLLSKFTVLAYLNIFLNSLPLLELDGYWILADALQIPDLRPRSLAFVRHELPRRLFRWERLSRVEGLLALYGVVGFLFTVFSFYTAYFFWEAVFGGLVRSLWDGGATGRVVLLVLTLFVGGPLIRAGLRLLRSGLREVRALAGRIRFRLESGWRVEAARMIDRLPLFDDVPVDVLDDLAGRVRLRAVRRGQTVVRQGERAEAFYVVRRGTLLVVERDPDTGAERPLRLLGPGEAFGELGLTASAPRSASVRALEHAEVFEVDKSTFDRLLADMVKVPDFAPSLQHATELRELRPFAHLEPDELNELLTHGAWVNFQPGETIVRKGAVGDAFYAIRSGQVDVTHGRARVTTLGPGEYFGEVALLLDVPRTATVRARTPVRAYRLDRKGFRRLVARAFRRGTLNPHMAPDRTWEH
ncbi:MAG: cyclic nucleotide-binding domain-containing protein [Actinomycetota bacterium]